MRWLELRIPPPVVALVLVGGMWAVARAGSVEAPGSLLLLVSAVLVIGGFAVMASGALSFRRARTTISPLKPESTTALVTSGIYAYTRNPMYLGMCLVLVGWASYLHSWLSLVGPVAFVLYIGRFQIRPEERALLSLFGSAYEAYQGQVRRWV